MNMKAIMFAGSGLFLSMVATTMWISSDMAEIRKREEAKRAAECAAAVAATPGTPTAADGAAAEVDPVTGAPVGGSLDATAAPTAERRNCPANGATGQASPTTGAVDPATGQPIDPAAAGANSGTMIDPATGQPVENPGTMPPMDATTTTDPAASGVTDPAATGGVTDPVYPSDAASGATAATDPAAAPLS